MKRVLPLLLILGFAGIAMFGPMLFGMGPGHAGGCIASSIDGTACPTNINNFAMHHLSALGTFSRAITPTLSDSLLALVLLLFVAVFASPLYKDLSYPKLQLLPRRFRDAERDSSYSRQKFISWLSLFELSPSVR